MTFRKTLSYDTKQKNEVIVNTDDIKKAIAESGIKNGTLFMYSLHTTMGMMIQEAVEPNLCQDFIIQLTKFVDDDGGKYKHSCAKHPSGTCKLDDFNGPSHMRQLLTNQHIIVDIQDGAPVLGRWQDIALFELDGPRKDRKIQIKIIED